MVEQKKPEEQSEIQPDSQFDLSQMLLAGPHLPYGTFLGYPYPLNFTDANIGLLDFGINEKEIEWLRRIQDYEKGCDTKYSLSLLEIARRILSEETSFNLSEYQISTSATGARGAITPIIKKLISKDKNVIAYGSPNWVFDNVVHEVAGARSLPFFAPNSEEFVRKFSQLPDKEKIAALIIVDPSNPLGYRFSKEQINTLEDIARKEKITPIFDDVFRGLQEQGNRRSASEYSKNSIIVETTSKRFGVRGVGATWTLIPKSLGLERIEGMEPECSGCSSLAALVTDALHSTHYEERIREKLIQNSRAFKQGFGDVWLDGNNQGKFIQAFEGMPIMNYFLPALNIQNAELIALLQRIYQKLGITSGYNWVCATRDKKMAKNIDPAEFVLGFSYLRICPTKETAMRSYFGGRIFAEELKPLANKTGPSS